MLKNVGNTDKLIRLVLGLLIIIVAGYKGSWWALLGVVLVITALTRTCVLYRLIGIDTNKTKAQVKPTGAMPGEVDKKPEIADKM